MTDAEFEAALATLLDDLDAAIKILDRNGQDHWREWFERDRAGIADGDRHALAHVLNAYGGMGSLNDLILGRDDAKFNRLRTRIWETTTAMLRDLDS